jgi:quercetin dioxygenase-like cupin family protein
MQAQRYRAMNVSSITRTRLNRRMFLLGSSAAAGVALVGCGSGEEESDALTAEEKEVVRHILAETPSAEAAGWEMILSRVVVPPGKELAPHTHPGLQSAVIHQGKLTYTVYSNEVQVVRGAASGQGRKEVVRAGSSTLFEPGDSLTEPQGMVHAAANRGKTPVVIYLSSLFPVGAPASSPATPS